MARHYRLRQTNSLNSVTAMTMMLYNLPRQILPQIEAFALFPGMGEIWRVRHIIACWENRENTVQYFLNTALNTREKTAEKLTIKHLCMPPYNLSRTECVITRVHAEHTKDQTEWLAKQVKKLDISSVAVFAPPYHCLRAYLTLLKSFIKREMNEVILIPMPTPISPSRITPETGSNAWGMVPGEVERIIRYQKKGDVATYQEFIAYMEWLWKHPIIAKCETSAS